MAALYALFVVCLGKAAHPSGPLPKYGYTAAQAEFNMTAFIGLSD